MKRLRFLVSLITQQNDYQMEQANAARNSAVHLGLDVEVLFADSDAVTQSQQLLQVIQSNAMDSVDAILLEPAGGTGLPVVAQAATRAHIGWVVLNREVGYIADLRRDNPTVPVFVIGPNQEEIGRIQGRQFGALLPHGGSMLYIQGPSSSSVSRQRAAGMYETKPFNIQVRVLKSASWTEEGGYQAIGSWLRLSTSHREKIDLVGCQNDAIAAGTRKAFQEYSDHKDKTSLLDLRFTGVDGLPHNGQEWVRRKLLVATVVVAPTTGFAMELMATALRQSSVPPELKLVEPVSYPPIEDLMGR